MSEDRAVTELADAIVARIRTMFEENPPAPEPWLDSVAVARLIGAEPSYLAHLRSQGRGPRWSATSTKFVRYRLADVQQWMAAHYENPAERGGES